MYLSKKEKDSVHDAIDFISSNIDGAEDQEYYQNILDGLMSITVKYKAERHKRLVNEFVKKLKAKP